MATPAFLEPGWPVAGTGSSMAAAAAQHIGAQLPSVTTTTTKSRASVSPRRTGSYATPASNAMEDVDASPSAKASGANGPVLLHCSFKGCDKVFKKSCKLIDHERTHTGERPFACQHEGCDKRFGRKDHLQRHLRSHASTEGDAWQNARPFECSVLTSDPTGASAHAICGKRFLTRQHLNRHVKEFHDQATSCDEAAKTHAKSTPRPATYACTIGDCQKTFSKRKLLRSHINVFHSDKGKAVDEMALDPAEAEHIARLPFPCTQDGCDRRFATNSKRMAHVEQKHSATPRYICPFDHSSDGTPDGIAQFFTWTELLAHQRQHHRPQCSVPTCKKVFKEQRSLRAHLMRCHGITANEQYLVEDDGSMTFDDLQSEQTLAARSRQNRDGRSRPATVPCSNELCDQMFTSRRASLRHLRKCRFSKGADGEEADVSDNGQTDNEWEDDGASENDDDFYRREGGAVPESSADRPKVHHRGQKRHRDTRPSKPVVTINLLTGQQYDDQLSTKKRKIRGRVLSCPWAQICRLQEEDGDVHDHQTCAFRFSRLYDVQRHLKGQHGVQLSQLDIRSLLHAEERLLLGGARSGTQIAKEEQQQSSDDDETQREE